MKILILSLSLLLLLSSCAPVEKAIEIEKTYCGNEKCESGEDSSTCCIDCGCPQGYDCDQNICKKLAVCGNGIKEEGETAENCCQDAGCSTGYKCEQNQCIELKPVLTTSLQQYGLKSVTYLKAKERTIASLSISNSGNSMAKDVSVRISSPDSYFNDEIINLGAIYVNDQQSREVKLDFTTKALDITSQMQLKTNIQLNFEDEHNRPHSSSDTATLQLMG